MNLAVKRRWYHKLIRPILQVAGFFGGYSGCLICHDTWNWKKEHSIDYAEDRGAFPVCEECWREKPAKQILQATKDLIDEWRIHTSSPSDTEIHSLLLLEATRVALFKRDGIKPPNPPVKEI